MAKTFKVTSPIKNYSGVGAGGVHFAYGKAEIQEGWVLDWYKNKGYEVEEIKEEKKEEKKKTAAKKK